MTEFGFTSFASHVLQYFSATTPLDAIDDKLIARHAIIAEQRHYFNETQATTKKPYSRSYPYAFVHGKNDIVRHLSVLGREPTELTLWLREQFEISKSKRCAEVLPLPASPVVQHKILEVDGVGRVAVRVVCIGSSGGASNVLAWFVPDD